jgi:hypothetical protein
MEVKSQRYSCSIVYISKGLEIMSKLVVAWIMAYPYHISKEAFQRR